MKYDFNSIDFDNVPDCLGKVFELLYEASGIMIRVMHMPIAEPDDPVWNEYWQKPNIHEITELFGMVYDAEHFAQDTIESIKGTPSA